MQLTLILLMEYKLYNTTPLEGNLATPENDVSTPIF